VELQRKQQLSKGLLKHRLFLGGVLEKAGPEFFVISAISFSQGQLVRTRSDIINGLLNTIEENKNNEAIKHESIRSIAADFGVLGSEPKSQAHASIVFQLGFSDLLDFFTQHQDAQPTLEMRCPFSGTPLPSIGINLGPTFGLDPAPYVDPDPSLGNSPDGLHMYTAKMNFSPGLGYKLIRYVMEKNDERSG
jgi:hypothetical protein